MLAGSMRVSSDNDLGAIHLRNWTVGTPRHGWLHFCSRPQGLSTRCGEPVSFLVEKGSL
jgi:hypothetical protein